jgi:ribose transport system permease protein
MIEMVARVGAPHTVATGVEKLRRHAQGLGLLWILVGLCAVAVYLSPSFIQVGNLLNVGRQMALFGIVSVGMTFVILTKGIDLSVGSVVGVVAVSTAMMMASGLPIPVVVVTSLVMGALCGLFNGVGVVSFNMPPFIMTLGTLVMGRGIAMTIANGEPQTLGSATDAFAFLGGGFLFGIPVPIWIFAVVAGGAFVVLRFTAFGRRVYAVGSNAEAARLVGINVGGTLLWVYVISGVLAALTALIYVSRLTVGEPTAGVNLELDAIAITVIGGTSLFGGTGSIGGTVIGAAIIVVIANILNLIGISPFTQQIVKGAIIIAAVMLESRRHRLRT